MRSWFQPGGKQVRLCGVGEWQVAGIVAQGSNTEYVAPILDRFLVHAKTFANVPYVVLSYHDIEYPSRYVRHTQRMLETGMRSPRVDHEGSCKLVNMSEPLDRWRVNKLPFAGSQPDESVNSIPYFMVFFRHCDTA